MGCQGIMTTTCGNGPEGIVRIPVRIRSPEDSDAETLENVYLGFAMICWKDHVKPNKSS